jgi:hypothetical protein
MRALFVKVVDTLFYLTIPGSGAHVNDVSRYNYFPEGAGEIGGSDQSLTEPRYEAGIYFSSCSWGHSHRAHLALDLLALSAKMASPGN